MLIEKLKKQINHFDTELEQSHKHYMTLFNTIEKDFEILFKEFNNMTIKDAANNLDVMRQFLNSFKLLHKYNTNLKVELESFNRKLMLNDLRYEKIQDYTQENVLAELLEKA